MVTLVDRGYDEAAMQELKGMFDQRKSFFEVATWPQIAFSSSLTHTNGKKNYVPKSNESLTLMNLLKTKMDVLVIPSPTVIDEEIAC